MPLAPVSIQATGLARLFLGMTVAAAAVFMLACNVTDRLGDSAIVFRHIAGIGFVLLCLAILGWRLIPSAAPARALGMARAALPLLAVFCVIVGIGRPANHALMFAHMAGDFWHGDPLFPFTRRPALSIIAHVIGIGPGGYIYLWSAMFCVLFCLAAHDLAHRGLSALERISLLSSSILAYLLIVPGYNEAFVFLMAFVCLRARLSMAEKILAAGLMIGAHEVAALLAAAFLATESETGERRAWIRVFAILYLFYFVGYVINWGGAVQVALVQATRPTHLQQTSSWQWVRQHPWSWAAGIVFAYKVDWLLAVRAVRMGRRQAIRLAGVFATIPLTFIATDTSRLVQFSSLSFLVMAADTVITLSPRRRFLLAWVNLAIPSLYIATNSAPVVGKGLYFFGVFLYIKTMALLGFHVVFALA